MNLSINRRLLIICFITASGYFANAQVGSTSSKDSKRDSLSEKNKLQRPVQEIKSGINLEVSSTKNEISGKAKSLVKDSILGKVRLLSSGKFFQTDTVSISGNYSYFRDTSGKAMGVFAGNKGVYDYSVDGKVLLTQIPFSVSTTANQGIYTNANSAFNDFYKFNFDPKKYQEILKQQVLGKINPEMVLGSLMNKINNIRKQYEQSLEKEVLSIKKQYESKFTEKLNLPLNVSDISGSDLSGLKNQLYSNLSIEKYRGDLAQYEEIIRTKGQSIADTLSEAKQVLARIQKFEAVNKVYEKVVATKDKFENNNTVKELRSHLPFTPDKFKSYLSKPGNLQEVVKQYGSLSGMQSLFMSMSKLDLGQNPIQNGDLNVGNVINNGVNAAFQGKKAGGGLIVGKSSTMNNWMQAGMQNIVSNEYSGITGFSFGTGSGSRTEQSVSMNLFNFMNTPGVSDPQSLQPAFLANANRQDAVITYHSGFKLGEKHNIKLDLSKSFGSYKNSRNEDGSAASKSAADGLLGNDGKSNYAAMLDYTGEMFNTGIQAVVKKVGLGYNNPGNVFLRKGETQLQLGLSRKLLKQRLTLKYKTDYRSQHFDPEKNFVSNSFSNKLQTSYRFKKNTRAGLSYQRIDYSSKGLQLAGGKGGSSILQADGSYRFFLNGKPVSNTVTVSGQNMKLPMLNGEVYRSKTLLLAHTSSVMVSKNLLVLSIMGNQSDNKDYFFNTAFLNTEANYVYTLAKDFRLTSGAGFYYNKGWNTQWGVRQQVSASLLKKLEFDLGVDIKRAINTVRPELANQIFINSSVRYQLN